jgi:predicted hydrocarbon binding protein
MGTSSLARAATRSALRRREDGDSVARKAFIEKSEVAPRLMRFVKLNQSELHKIKDLYEGVMSHACHGLFFKEGSVVGSDMAEEALKDRARFHERASEILKERGWIEEIQFRDGEVVAKGSIEVTPSDIPTCHRLRGILREFYERFKGGRIKCTEEVCASVGPAAECRFRIEEL